MKKNNKNNKNKIALLLISLLVPLVSFAALEGLTSLMQGALDVLNNALSVLIALSLAFFLWGLAQFVLHAGEDKARDEGKKRMLWGIIALFVMFAIFGILNWIGQAIGIDPNGGIQNIIGG